MQLVSVSTVLVALCVAYAARLKSRGNSRISCVNDLPCCCSSFPTGTATSLLRGRLCFWQSTFFASFSRASIACTTTTDMWPTILSPNVSCTSAEWVRSARLALVNSANARKKVDSPGSVFHIENPQTRLKARFTVRRSISHVVVVKPNAAVSTQALTNIPMSYLSQAHPLHVDLTNYSIRAHSRVCITCSSFGVSAPTLLS